MPDDPSYEVTFEEVLSRAQLECTRDPSIIEHANVLISASYFDAERNVVDEAKKKLLTENAKKLYLECLKDLISRMNSASKSEKFIWASSINDLALQGLGIKIDDLAIKSNDIQEITLSSPNWNNIERHINRVVLGNTFISELSVGTDADLWGNETPLRISACDASQHRDKLKIPLNPTFSSPFVVNNAAGIIKTNSENGEKPKWENVFVPKNTHDFENWVIVGFKDYTELTDNDYEWATKSAMDVGQFYVEETRIFQGRGTKNKPDIHIRDGRIFPQDHAMNCAYTNRHGDLTREAILRMTNTLKRARELNITFCGASKQTTLKVYSTVIDWYITTKMGEEKWNKTRHILSDTEVMRRFLYNPNFNAKTFSSIYVTTPILRPFYTTSNLNRRTDQQVQNDLNRLKKVTHGRGITAADIVNEAMNYSVAMFFAGHVKTSELYFPRYEFVYYEDNKEDIYKQVTKILSGLRLASFDVDADHLWGLEEPVKTLLPTPLMLAHDLSKKMGEDLAKNWVARTYAEFIKRKKEMGLQ